MRMSLTFHVQSSILRYHAFIALEKSLTTGKRRAITDTVGKDIVKQMKAALTDKSLPVQRAAAVVHIFVMFVVFLS
jgi:HEAT repeat-containing protein 5